MKRWIGSLVAVACVILTLSAAGWCEEAKKASGEAIRLEEIVVTATKTEKKVEDAPGSVTVIDKEEMKKKNIETVDDALNSLSGLFVKRSKGLMDSTTSVRMRGFAGDEYTLVLIDGQPLNDAYTGGVEYRGDSRPGFGALRRKRHGRGHQHHHQDTAKAGT